MRRSFYFVLITGLMGYAAQGLAGCGGSGGQADRHSPDTSSVGPAPDNNSANNPSLADTSYEKNRTRPITDTMKNK
jgi:hypothetical protein